MGGKLVSEGTPPPHRCEDGRPSPYEVNDGAVWLCECGRFWKRRTVHSSAYSYEYGDVDTSGPGWVKAKDASGAEFTREEVPPGEYLRDVGWFRATCAEHGRVDKGHRHHRLV